MSASLPACHVFCSSSFFLTAASLVCFCRFPAFRSFLTHCVQPQRIHRLPLFGSPAGSLRASAEYIIFLRFALVYKAVASCSALRAVMVFAEKKGKNSYQPFASTCAGQRPEESGLPCPSPLLHSQTARASPGHSPQTVRASLIAACSLPFLAAGAFSFVRNPHIVKLLNDRKRKKKETRQIANY